MPKLPSSFCFIIYPPPRNAREEGRVLLNSPVDCERATTGALASATGVRRFLPPYQG